MKAAARLNVYPRRETPTFPKGKVGASRLGYTFKLVRNYFK